jgi:hypothetical protein
MATSGRKYTWLAAVLCIVAVIPAHMVAGVAEYVYQHAVGEMLPDPFGLHFIFGVDWLARPLAWIVVVGIGSVLRGIVAGALAAWVTNRLVRRASIMRAAFTTGAAYTVLTAIAFVVTLFTIGVTRDAVETILELIGLWIGLFSVAASAPETQAS